MGQMFIPAPFNTSVEVPDADLQAFDHAFVNAIAAGKIFALTWAGRDSTQAHKSFTAILSAANPPGFIYDTTLLPEKNWDLHTRIEKALEEFGHLDIRGGTL